MIISLIAAMASNGVIGRDNQMPWHLPADFKHFKALTLGKPIIMGRKTFESIGSRPLPGRTNVVVTRDTAFQAEGCVVVHDVEAALVAEPDAAEVMIIGGTNLYTQLLPRADRLYLTEVHAEVEGDASFPPIDCKRWREMSREDHPADARHSHSYSFVRYERL